MGCEPSYGSISALAGNALLAGAKMLSQSHLEWDIAGGCESPVLFDVSARPDFIPDPRLAKLDKTWRKALKQLVPNVPMTGKNRYWEAGMDSTLWVTLHVRCRRCVWCLKQRAILWANKARYEIERSPRTWFATYTASPDQQARWIMGASLACSKRSVAFERLSETDQFREICREAGPDITRYVKRVRKQTGAKLRYLWVAERHQSGLPHWHALVHDLDPTRPIRKAVLKGQWNHGFSRFKLVEHHGAAWYLCKYLSKDIATRVRSSLEYGKQRELHAFLKHSNPVRSCVGA